MRFDYKLYDGLVLLGAQKSRGLWAAQFQLIGGVPTRNGGRLNLSATNHTLLTFALVSGLRSISNKMATGAVSKRRDGRTRPLLLVKAIDPTFLPALKSAMGRQKGPTLRVIKSLHQPLAKQLSRFTFSFETEENNPAILGMRDWAANNVLPPSADINVEQVFLPAAVNLRDTMQARF